MGISSCIGCKYPKLECGYNYEIYYTENKKYIYCNLYNEFIDEFTIYNWYMQYSSCNSIKNNNNNIIKN